MSSDKFDVSDSDDDYDANERMLLDKVKSRPSRVAVDAKKGVYAFDDDDDDQDEGMSDDDDGEEAGDASDLDMGSDIEDRDDDGLPDDRAWGQNKKSFYSTDYVDKDYSGMYNEAEAEAAELEEQEARTIQKRLMEQLSEADFSLADFADISSQPTEGKTETIQTDLSTLSKRQKLEMFRKESPEFDVLVNDFEAKMTEMRERIIPVLDLIKQGKLAKSPAGDFLRTKNRIILNYCANIVFYVLLKTKRLPVKDHPVLKALFRYRQLLNQLQPVYEQIISPQVDKILETFANSQDSAETGLEPDKSAKKKKKVLKILKTKPKKQKKATTAAATPSNEKPSISEEASDSSDEDDARLETKEDVVEEGEEKQEKRAITYEMAKNKGLTPKRSKEQRNPRVKHRNKFRKANIRRRGQVRTPRSEIPVYGGEPTGIKIGLKKGRKLM